VVSCDCRTCHDLFATAGDIAPRFRDISRCFLRPNVHSENLRDHLMKSRSGIPPGGPPVSTLGHRYAQPLRLASGNTRDTGCGWVDPVALGSKSQASRVVFRTLSEDKTHNKGNERYGKFPEV
jgi:hypothetical protein